MVNRQISRPVAWITTLLFFLVSILSLWRIIQDGPTTSLWIATGCFFTGGVLWSFILIRSKRTDKPESEKK